MFIGNVACCEPGVSGVGWVWIDVGHLELNGYTDEAIGAEGELVAVDFQSQPNTLSG